MNRKIIIGFATFIIGFAALIFIYPQYFSSNKVRILITHYDYRRGYVELSGIADNIGKSPVKHNPQLHVRVFDNDKNTITESNISLMQLQTDNPDVTPRSFGEFDCLIKIPSGHDFVNWELSVEGVSYVVEQKNKPLTE